LANDKLPDLAPALTLFITLSACVMKSPLWRTEFDVTQTHRYTLHGKLSEENYLRREPLTKGNVSKYYKNIIH